MKHLEDLARQRVQEALQAGLRSQQLHRQLGDRRPSRVPLWQRLAHAWAWWGSALHWAARMAAAPLGLVPPTKNPRRATLAGDSTTDQVEP